MNREQAKTLITAASKVDARLTPRDEADHDIAAEMWSRSLATVPVDWALDYIIEFYGGGSQYRVTTSDIGKAWRKATGDSTFPEGHCRVEGCRCTHTDPCVYGLRRKRDRVLHGRHYETWERCPECAKPLESRSVKKKGFMT